MLGEARVRAEVDAGRVQQVVRGDQEIGRRRSRRRNRELGRTRNISGAAGVGDAYAVAFGPCCSLRSRDPRHEQHRTAIAGDALQHTDTPVAQPEVHEVRILGTPRVFPGMRQARAHARELTEHGVDLIDDVRRLRAEPPAALRRVAPPQRHLGIGSGEQRDVQHERSEARLADRAAAQDTREERLSRRESEFRTHQMHDTGALRGSEQTARLGCIARERLLAQDVPARVYGVEHESGVRVRRRRNDYRVDTRERPGVAQAGERVRDLESLRAHGGLVGVAPDEGVYFEAGPAQRAHVGEAAEAGTDHHRADGHAGIPAAFATIDSIVYWPTTNRISTSAGAS